MNESSGRERRFLRHCQRCIKASALLSGIDDGPSTPPCIDTDADAAAWVGRVARLEAALCRHCPQQRIATHAVIHHRRRLCTAVEVINPHSFAQPSTSQWRLQDGRGTREGRQMQPLLCEPLRSEHRMIKRPSTPTQPPGLGHALPSLGGRLAICNAVMCDRHPCVGRALVLRRCIGRGVSSLATSGAQRRHRHDRYSIRRSAAVPWRRVVRPSRCRSGIGDVSPFPKESSTVRRRARWARSQLEELVGH